MADMKKDVLLYDGEGSSEQSVLMAFHTLKNLLDNTPYNVQKISPDTILKGNIIATFVTLDASIYFNVTHSDKIHLCAKTVATLYVLDLVVIDISLSGGWQKTTALLIIGGGYDLGYINALKSEGTAMIRKYVEDGGSYLGICAGGYFGCNYIEFDKGGPLEVCGKRELGFYSGQYK